MLIARDKLVEADISPVSPQYKAIIGRAWTPTSKSGSSDWYLVPLDRLTVSEGVFRKEQLTSVDELVTGDEFQFPILDDQSRASHVSLSGSALLQVFTTNRFGPSSFSTTITLGVTFLSEIGHQLTGYVLEGSLNAIGRPCVLLSGQPRAKQNYILIEVMESQNGSDSVSNRVDDLRQSYVAPAALDKALGGQKNTTALSLKAKSDAYV